MHRFLILVAAILLVVSLDLVAFRGQHVQAVWLQAQHYGQQLNAEIQYWLRKAGAR
jgi:hypothetical protein